MKLVPKRGLMEGWRLLTGWWCASCLALVIKSVESVQFDRKKAWWLEGMMGTEVRSRREESDRNGPTWPWWPTAIQLPLRTWYKSPNENEQPVFTVWLDLDFREGTKMFVMRPDFYTLRFLRANLCKADDHINSQDNTKYVFKTPCLCVEALIKVWSSHRLPGQTFSLDSETSFAHNCLGSRLVAYVAAWSKLFFVEIEFKCDHLFKVLGKSFWVSNLCVPDSHGASQSFVSRSYTISS